MRRALTSLLLVVLSLPLPVLVAVLADGLGGDLDANHDAPLGLEGDLLLEVLISAEGDSNGHPEVPLGLQLDDLLARDVAVPMLAQPLALGRQAVHLAVAGHLGLLVKILDHLRGCVLRDVGNRNLGLVMPHPGRRGQVRVGEGPVEDGLAAFEKLLVLLGETAAVNEDGERLVSVLPLSGPRGRSCTRSGFGAVERQR